MVKSKNDLNSCILLDKIHYEEIIGYKKYRHHLVTDPIADQWYIWKYIKTMRYCEYHINNDGIIHTLKKIWYLHKLRKLSRITGFQIPPNTIGAGLTIWHWGPIIINPKARLGEQCTINPMVIIGHKHPGEGAPQLGKNVFVGGGAKIIGDIVIGDDVIIAPNAVVVNNIPSGKVVAGIPGRIIKDNTIG